MKIDEKKAFEFFVFRMCGIPCRKAKNNDGGPGSGNWGHEGRKGKVGGSEGGGGIQNRFGNSEKGFTSFAKDKKKYATPHKTDYDEIDAAPDKSIFITHDGKYVKKKNFQSDWGGDDSFVNCDTGETIDGYHFQQKYADEHRENVSIIIPDSANPNYKKISDSSDDDKFSKERKGKALDTEDPEVADKCFREQTGEVWNELDNHTKDMLCDYTTFLYREMNDYLRFGTEPEDIYDYAKPGIQDVSKAIDKCPVPRDVVLHRGINGKGFASMVGIDANKLFKEDDISQIIGMEVQDKGFMSCSSAKNYGFTGKPVQLNIYCPKGTKAIYAEPFSLQGHGGRRDWDGKQKQKSYSKEFETILQRGTKLRITNVSKDKYDRYYVNCDVIGQDYE